MTLELSRPVATPEGDRSTADSRLRRWLRPVAELREDELATALLLGLAAFLLLCAYYLLKVAREPLIVAGAGPEWKVYSYAGQLVVLLAGVRAYSWLCARLSRLQLITAIMSVFVVSLGGFLLLARAGPAVGVAFYVWVGIFNVATVAQFWALAADVYRREQGERLFPLLGVGAALGGFTGAYGARWLNGPLGTSRLMFLALALVVAYIAVVWIVHHRERLAPASAADHDAPIGDSATLDLFRHDRYLLAIGLLTLLMNTIGTVGEYVLDRQLLEAAHLEVTSRQGSGLTAQGYIAGFRSSFFAWVNLLALLLQMFIVPRLIGGLGVGRVLLMVPVLALVGTAFMALLPFMAVIGSAKVLENSATHSVQKTAREALFLVLSREAKYKAKTFIDTVFWRTGDVLAAFIVWFGSRHGLPVVAFLLVNLALGVIWLELSLQVVRHHRARSQGLREVDASSTEPVPGTLVGALHC